MSDDFAPDAELVIVHYQHTCDRCGVAWEAVAWEDRHAFEPPPMPWEVDINFGVRGARCASCEEGR
jgi:hypothetical protein